MSNLADEIERSCPYEAESIECALASYRARKITKDKKVDDMLIGTFKDKALSSVVSQLSINKIKECDSPNYMIFLRDAVGKISKTKISLSKGAFGNPKTAPVTEKNLISMDKLKELSNNYKERNVYLIDTLTKKMDHRELLNQFASNLLDNDLEARGIDPREFALKLLSGHAPESDKDSKNTLPMFG